MSTEKNTVATPTGEAPLSERKREQIAARAYEIAEHQGFPCGCEIAHWLQAENELTAGQPHACCAGADTATEAPTA